MHRIDTPTAQTDKFGAGKNGFTNGDPGTGRRATDLNSDMWDAVQEEICNTIEKSGAALSKDQHDQLYTAIVKLITDRVPDALLRSNNLSDLADKAVARANIGLGNSATRNVGTGVGTVAAGDDSRIVVALDRTKNLSDLNNVPAARMTLGIKGAGLLEVGSTAGTVAAGDDSRIVVALDRTKNLSDLNNVLAARTTLGIKGAGLLEVGTTAGSVAAGNDSRITGAMQKSANGSDITDRAAFRSALQLGTAAQYDIGTSNEVVAGTASKLVSIPGLAALFDLGATALNGSIRIPNRPGGILIAWGTVAAGSDGIFTTAFSSPPFVLAQVNSIGETPFGPTHVYIMSTTTTGFTTATQTISRKYIAIGK